MALPMQDCIVLLGDSLTQRMDSPGNLHQRMAEAYQRKLDIHNRGFGGYTTAWAMPLLDQIFAKKGQAEGKPAVRLVTVWFGTNDSVPQPRAQYLPIETFRSNMIQILSALTSPDSPYHVANTPVSIIVITPGPPLFSQMPEYKWPGRDFERTRAFKDEVLRIGREWKERELQQDLKTSKNGEFGWKIETLDFWDALTKEAGGEKEELAPYYFDGLHLTTAGYTILWDNLAETIKTKFKGRGLDWEDFDDLPRRVPLYSEVDADRPESVVERMALPRIRGGTGPVKVEQNGYEG